MTAQDESDPAAFWKAEASRAYNLLDDSMSREAALSAVISLLKESSENIIDTVLRGGSIESIRPGMLLLMEAMESAKEPAKAGLDVIQTSEHLGARLMLAEARKRAPQASWDDVDIEAICRDETCDDPPPV
jgi:hypothetical protein